MLLLGLHQRMSMFVHQRSLHVPVNCIMHVHLRMLNSVHMLIIQHYVYTSAYPEFCAYLFHSALCIHICVS